MNKDDEKTVSITEITSLKFKAMKPMGGEIEIANCSDAGRICTIKIKDFKSKGDAKVYADLLALAPQLLREYIKRKKIKQAVVDLEKRINKKKEKGQT
jgi:uncharacterized cysteine cluster protein YcgN (CxxCxxCC family)